MIFRGIYMKIPYVFKKCTKCGRWLVASTVNFYKHKTGKHGLRGECKECRNKQNKQWYENNREEIAEQKKQYYGANRDKIFEYHKRYYKSPQGQVASFNHHQRRRIKEEQQGAGVTKAQWVEMMSFFGWRCAYSGEILTKDNRTIDHIVPLNSNGNNMIWNCVPMTRSLNSSKRDKDMLEWYKEQDFYSEARLAKIYEWKEHARNKWYKEEK